MYETILKLMREKVRLSQYVMTLHGEEEMDEDDLTIFDIESAILTGRIFERQRDQKTAEWKYLVRGQSNSNEDIIVVAKLGPTNKLVIITVYRP